MRTIQRPNLVLDPLTAADASAMFALLQDGSLFRYMDDQPPHSVEQLRAVYARRAIGRSPDGTELWFNWIVRSSAGVAMGFVQATLLADGRCLVAYVLGSAFQGQGYAGQAVQAMLDFLAQQHGVRRCWAQVEAQNLRSIHLLERLGFVPAVALDLAGFELTASERLYVRTLT